ncbi:hypothetical protein BJX62DRAFT_221486 [Aspergillus germanicus]
MAFVNFVIDHVVATLVWIKRPNIKKHGSFVGFCPKVWKGILLGRRNIIIFGVSVSILCCLGLSFAFRSSLTLALSFGRGHFKNLTKLVSKLSFKREIYLLNPKKQEYGT